jgi:hypothetical protein
MNNITSASGLEQLLLLLLFSAIACMHTLMLRWHSAS